MKTLNEICKLFFFSQNTDEGGGEVKEEEIRIK